MVRVDAAAAHLFAQSRPGVRLEDSAKRLLQRRAAGANEFERLLPQTTFRTGTMLA